MVTDKHPLLRQYAEHGATPAIRRAARRRLRWIEQKEDDLGMRVEGLTKTLLHLDELGSIYSRGKMGRFIKRQRKEMRREILRRAGMRGGR